VGVPLQLRGQLRLRLRLQQKTQPGEQPRQQSEQQRQLRQQQKTLMEPLQEGRQAGRGRLYHQRGVEVLKSVQGQDTDCEHVLVAIVDVSVDVDGIVRVCEAYKVTSNII